MTDIDLPKVVAVEERAFATPWSRIDFVSGLDSASGSQGKNFVMERGAEILGYCCLGWLGPVVEIQNIAVDPDLQRAGLGRWMLERVRLEAVERKAEAIWLEVRRGNRAARALYQASGFAERGIRPAYYRDTGEDAILLELTLLK